MGKLKTRVKGPGSKGKRWAKGQSSSSNPSTNKHREAAKGRFFQPFLLNNNATASTEKAGLTEEALMQHTYASDGNKDFDTHSEIITAPPSVSQGDFGDDETASVRSGLSFRSNSSFKTFATGFSNCSNISFSKLYRGFTPNSALHREMLAVLAAISEVVKQQGGKESDTEYYAALMTALEVSETNEDSLGATLCLLGMVIRRVPTSVLKKTFGTSSKNLLDLLGRFVESENALIVRSLIGCLGVLLRNQDVPVWSASSTLQIYDALLTFVASPKSQIRKASHHAICAILKASTLLTATEDAPLIHPVASRTGQACLSSVERLGFGGDPAPLLHWLNLMKEIMCVLPLDEVRPLCESLLKLMTLNNALVTSGAMQCLHGLMIGRPDGKLTLTADLNARLLTALYDYQPGTNDTRPLLAWLKVAQQTLLNLGRLHAELAAGHLPRFFTTTVQLWATSDRPEILRAVCPTLSPLLENCSFELAMTDKLARSLEQSLGYRTVKSWKYVIHLSTQLIETAGKVRPEAIKSLVRALTSLRSSAGFAHETEVDFAIGKVVRVCGPRFLLEQCVPLAITGREKDPYDFPNSWLLPIMRENISCTQLSYFTEYFLPLADVCRSRVQVCKDEQDRVGFRVFDLLQRQMWGLLPGFCKRPTDGATAFKPLAKLLGQAISDRPDIRLDVMAAIRQLIIHSETDEAVRNEMKRYAKNYLPLLFNLYTTKATSDEQESHRSSVYETIGYYLRLADDELLHSLFDKAFEKMQTAHVTMKEGEKTLGKEATDEDKLAQEEKRFVWQSVLALLRTLVLHQDPTRIESLVQFCLPWILNGTKVAAKEQKKAYGIVEDIIHAETEQCSKHVKSNLKRIVKLLTQSAKVVQPTSRPSRLRSLARLASLLEDMGTSAVNKRFLLNSAGEAVASIRAAGEKVRQASTSLLIVVGNILVKWSEGTDKSALKMYLTNLMKEDNDVACSLTAVTIVVHELASHCTEELMDTVLTRVCTMLVESSERDVVQACLIFIRMFTVTVHSQRLPIYVARLVKALSGMTEELQRVFMLKTRDIFIRLVRKCGAEVVLRLVPAEDEVLVKRINNIRKTEARKKRQKLAEKERAQSEGADEDEDDEVPATQPKTMEHMLADSDDDSDLPEDEREEAEARGKKQPKTWIQEDETSIVDFLDPAAARKVTATRPQRAELAEQLAEKKKRKESIFKTAPDGRMIIDDAGSDSDSSSADSEGIDITQALSNLKVDRKRKLPGPGDDEDEEEVPAFKYRAGGTGIHRPIDRKSKPESTGSVRKLTSKQRLQISKESNKPAAKDFGAEYRSTKARGDVKRKGKPDPFAYLPLERSALNKRKKAKLSGQFKGLVRAARKGASSGTKVRALKNKAKAN